MADIFDWATDHCPNTGEWLSDIKSEAHMYENTIEALKKEKTEQMTNKMFMEASNTEKIIHALEHKIEECKKRYQAIEDTWSF